MKPRKETIELLRELKQVLKDAKKEGVPEEEAVEKLAAKSGRKPGTLTRYKRRYL